MRFFTHKEPFGNITIHCERQAQGLYSVEVVGHRILVPTEMEKEIKNIVARYINGHGYDIANNPVKPYING